MTDTNRDGTPQAIEDALQNYLTDADDQGVIVTKWFAVCEIVSATREYSTLCMAYSPTIKSWEVVGMADWASSSAVDQWNEQGNDD